MGSQHEAARLFANSLRSEDPPRRGGLAPGKGGSGPGHPRPPAALPPPRGTRKRPNPPAPPAARRQRGAPVRSGEWESEYNRPEVKQELSMRQERRNHRPRPWTEAPPEPGKSRFVPYEPDTRQYRYQYSINKSKYWEHSKYEDESNNQNGKKGTRRMNKIGPHRDIYEQYNAVKLGLVLQNEKRFHSAVVIQKYLRGWIVRHRLNDIKRKVLLRHGKPWGAFLQEHEGLVRRVQRLYGAEDIPVSQALVFLCDYLERKEAYEQVFRSLTDGDDLPRDRILEYFRLCGLNPLERDVIILANKLFDGCGSRAEVALILDLNPDLGHMSLALQNDAVKQTIYELDPGAHDLRLAFLPWRSDKGGPFNLTSFSCSHDVLHAMEKAGSQGGGGSSLEDCITTLVPYLKEAREGVPKTVIVLSDAQEFTSLPENVIEELSATDCRVILIGKDEALKQTGLSGLGGGDLYQIRDYEAARKVKSDVMRKACTEACRYCEEEDVEETGYLGRRQVLELVFSLYPPAAARIHPIDHIAGVHHGPTETVHLPSIGGAPESNTGPGPAPGSAWSTPTPSPGIPDSLPPLPAGPTPVPEPQQGDGLPALPNLSPPEPRPRTMRGRELVRPRVCVEADNKEEKPKPPYNKPKQDRNNRGKRANKGSKQQKKKASVGKKQDQEKKSANKKKTEKKDEEKTPGEEKIDPPTGPIPAETDTVLAVWPDIPVSDQQQEGTDPGPGGQGQASEKEESVSEQKPETSESSDKPEDKQEEDTAGDKPEESKPKEEKQEDKPEEDRSEEDRSEKEKSDEDNHEEDTEEESKPEKEKSEDAPLEDKPQEEKSELDKPEAKAEEDKAQEDKPEEDKPEEDKPEEDKPKEDKPEEDKPEEDKQEEDKQEEDKTEDDTQGEPVPDTDADESSPDPAAEPPGWVEAGLAGSPSPGEESPDLSTPDQRLTPIPDTEEQENQSEDGERVTPDPEVVSSMLEGIIDSAVQKLEEENQSSTSRPSSSTGGSRIPVKVKSGEKNV